MTKMPPPGTFLSTVLGVVKYTVEACGFTDDTIIVRPAERISGAVVEWKGHGYWMVDVGMMRSAPIAVAGLATSARGRDLFRTLLDLVDDNFEPFTDDDEEEDDV